MTLNLSLFIILTFLTFSCSTTPVTGNKRLILISEHEEMLLGEKSFREILSKERVINNQTAVNLSKIGKRIAAVTGKNNYQWEFKLIDNPEPNAFCLPGGKVGFHTGMLSIATDPDQVAAVMAHEIGHALARHGGQRLTAQMGTQVALTALSLTTLANTSREKKQVILGALGIGALYGILLPYSRSNEEEADHIGLVIMHKAGFDPYASVRLWEKMEQLHPNKGSSFFSTHPTHHERIQRLKEHLKNM